MTGNLIPLVGALQKFVAESTDSDRLFGLDSAVSELGYIAEDRRDELLDAEEGIEIQQDGDWFLKQINKAIEASTDKAECQQASEMLLALEKTVLDKMRELGPPK
jgi:hypothetical protein